MYFLCRRRKKSRLDKADIPAKDAQQPDEGKDAGTTCQRSSSQDFFEVDLDNNSDDTRMAIYTDEEYSLERNGHWTENVDIGSHSDGKHCAGQEWNPLKPVGKTADKDKSVVKKATQRVFLKTQTTRTGQRRFLSITIWS